MSYINELHEEAMELTDEALLAKRGGQHDEAVKLFHRAFELEREAAELLRENLTAEPTRSILYRSAATLAIDCGELQEAMRLVTAGLAGNPPLEIADELRELRVRLQHLQSPVARNNTSLTSTSERKLRKRTPPYIPNTSIPQTLATDTSVTYVRHRLISKWSSEPSRRTVLYYSFLLTRQYENQPAIIRNSLTKTTSLPKNEFENIVRELASDNIMTSTQECKLSPIAMLEMEKLLEQDLGNADPVPYDGVKIFTATPKERRKLWLEAGTQQLYNLFSSVPGLKMSQTDLHKDYRILSLEWSNDLPIVVFCFINKSILTKIDEVIPVVHHVRNTIFPVQRGASASEGTKVSQLKITTIIAAPSYSTSIAHSTLSFGIPVKLVGPLNFAAIIHYLQNHVDTRELQLRALLNYLDPDRGISKGGLLFSPPLIEYMKIQTANS
jgi:tetratricopeptide (TPR) repeat protein